MGTIHLDGKLAVRYAVSLGNIARKGPVMNSWSDMRRLWDDSGIGSCVEGVVKEFEQGNVLQVQKWYFKLRKDSQRLAIRDGILPAEIWRRALENVGSDVARRFENIVQTGLRPGGPLEEIESWIREHPEGFPGPG